MVSIDIDLDASGVHADIVALKAELESLEDDFDFDFDLDGNLGKKLDELSDSLEGLTEGLTKDLDESIAKIENIDPVVVEHRGDGSSGGDTGSDSGDDDGGGDTKKRNRRRLGDIWRDLQLNKTPKDGQLTFNQIMKGMEYDETRFKANPRSKENQPRSYSDSDSLKSAMKRVRDKVPGTYSNSGYDSSSKGGRHVNPGLLSMKRMRGMIASGEVSSGKIRGDGKLQVGAQRFDWDVGREGKSNGFLDKMDGLGGKVNKNLSKLIPNMQMWWNIIGALLPALGAFAVQVAGVAAAMGSVAVAGGALVGLGLLGHGENMSDSFENAKDTLGELKKEMFQTFQPTAQMFAPIADQFFDKLPGQMDKVADSMEGLTAFDGDLFSMLEGGTDFLAELIDVMVRNQSIISEMANTFGAVLGDTLIGLFEWLLKTGYENMDMLMSLGRSLGLIAVTLFNVFMLVGRATAMLSPFFEILAGVSQLLNNQFFSGIFAIIAGIFILTTAVSGLFSAFLSIGTLMMGVTLPIFSTLFTMIQGVTMNILLATSATYAFAQAIATAVAAATMLAGIGLVAWTGLQAAKGMKQANNIASKAGAAGVGQRAGRSGSGGGTYNDNRNYEINMNGSQDNADREGVADILQREDSRGTPY
jgi:hypothetical protein